MSSSKVQKLFRVVIVIKLNIRDTKNIIEKYDQRNASPKRKTLKIILVTFHYGISCVDGNMF